MTQTHDQQPTADETPRPTVPDRRRVLRGVAAVGGVAVGGAFLAACGSDSGGDAATSSDPTTAAGGGAGTELGATSDVPVGSAAVFADAQVFVSQPTEGDFKAFTNICTHSQCPMTTIEAEKIVCTCHGSEFAVADGSVLQGPAADPLAEAPVTVKKGSVFLA